MGLLNYVRTLNYCVKVLDSCTNEEQRGLVREWSLEVARKHAIINRNKTGLKRLKEWLK